MKTGDLVSVDFVTAFSKILENKPPRSEIQKLRKVGKIIYEAQKKHDYHHRKNVQIFGLRDSNGKLVEFPVGNGRARFELQPDKEEEFLEAMKPIVDAEVELPVQLSGAALASMGVLTARDFIALGDLMDDSSLDEDTTPASVVPFAKPKAVEAAEETQNGDSQPEQP